MFAADAKERRLVHDLRNVLTAIRGYGEMLTAGVEGDERLHAHAEHLTRATDRAVELTEELAEMSGDDAGR